MHARLRPVRRVVVVQVPNVARFMDCDPADIGTPAIILKIAPLLETCALRAGIAANPDLPEGEVP